MSHHKELQKVISLKILQTTNIKYFQLSHHKELQKVTSQNRLQTTNITTVMHFIFIAEPHKTFGLLFQWVQRHEGPGAGNDKEGHTL